MAAERKTNVRNVPVLEVKQPQRINYNDWFNQLYDANHYNDEDVQALYDALKYIGFDRQEVLTQLYQIAPDVNISSQIVIACALRGPQSAAKIQLSNGQTIEHMGIPASGQKKTKKISCNKVTAATADLAAFYLKRMNVPKRLISSDCPAWLQFPSAGAIKLPENLRQAHIQFSKAFSPVIGGAFSETIYSQMVSNAYLNENLHLF